MRKSRRVRIRWQFVLVTLLFVLTNSVIAQKSSQDVYVDKNGIMRWGHNREEVRAFGVNYTAMFAHAYRAAKRLNIPLEKAIDDDIYHFARLGFDAFRVHVWDTEISDTLGHLLNNDHLKLFDYALSKMKARGMKFIITPIAYWGNGWPERDEATPGFSRKYGKDNCLTHPDAILAQEQYLFEFLNHKNEYTGIAYKEDPAIIAFEVSNEPHHRESPDTVTAFINRMVKSMRRTGCKKPIFYNISHSIHLADAYFDSDIQGGTFQWYPTGLGAGHELKGNFLPNVDHYMIPFANHPKFRKMAKLVYEFDAADIGRSYIYPAMARSFREAGMQIATHFAYDPTFMADVNTEYGTHYMNLAYTPRKALSLMIASEVFHEIPMYARFGKYPHNTTFQNFSVNYEEDLAEMVSESKFLYTNHTTTSPPSPDNLETIAGYGNSAIVAYEGTGAYFLDRLQEGVWRFEVMPDAIWIRDPFEKTSPKKQVAVIHWNEWPVTIDLPDLGKGFEVKAINDGNAYATRAGNGNFVISPGTYLLTRAGTDVSIDPQSPWKNINLKEFVAPKPTLDKIYVRHEPGNLVSNTPFTIDAFVASPGSLQSVQLYFRTQGSRPETFDMKRVQGYDYTFTVPAEKIKEGIIQYHIIVKEKDLDYTFPSGRQTHPHDWDFYDQNPYHAAVISASSPVLLFDAATDAGQFSRQWLQRSGLVPSWHPARSQLAINVEKLFIPDPENPDAARLYDYSMRYYVGDKIGSRGVEVSRMRKIVLRARSLNEKPCPFQIALITKQGSAFGGMVVLHPEPKDYELSLDALKPVRLVTLPRPYPTFLPYYFDHEPSGSFNVREAEALQLSIGPGIPEDELNQPHGISIEHIRLE